MQRLITDRIGLISLRQVFSSQSFVQSWLLFCDTAHSAGNMSSFPIHLILLFMLETEPKASFMLRVHFTDVSIFSK